MSGPVTTFYRSPLGLIEITGSASGIQAVRFRDDPPAIDSTCPDTLAPCVEQLHAYFEGTLTAFDLPLDLRGTPFQRRVWQALLAIPFGATRSYADIARALGDPNAVRAVGTANGRNPIAIIVPCHRVIGSDGSLTGYGGGLWRKEWLLAHEGHPRQRPLW